MNERIRNLQIQAFAECKTFEDDKVRTDDVFERFAELIVRECIAQCEKNVDHEYLGWGSKLSACNIKHHFGVEE